MNKEIQQYKLLTMQLRKLPPWKGDWLMPGMDERVTLVGRRWRLFESMTWSAQDEVRAWERARKVAIS